MPLIVGGIAAPIIGGIAGNLLSKGDRDAALAMQQQALQNIQNVNTPDIEKMKLALQQYQNLGQLTPEMEKAIAQKDSEMKSIQVDPRLRNAQMQALQSLQKVGAGGLRPEDIAAITQVKNAVAQQDKANQEAILQNMQQRGIGGSGNELAARLMSSQNAANRASDQDMNVAGQASQRALQALAQSGNMGQSMETTQFGEAAQTANAQDIINRYNAMNAQQVANQNVAVKNAAQAQNLANAQSIANQNVGLNNQQQQYNTGLQQQQFQNQLSKAQAGVAPSNNVSNAYMNNAAATQSLFSGLGQGVGQGSTAVANYNQNQNYMDILKGAAK